MTLDADNLLWLRGRAATRKRRSLSDALDEILTSARMGAHGLDASRSVVGTIDIAADDPDLSRADADIRGDVEASLSRPLAVNEPRVPYGAGRKVKAPKRATRKPTRA